MRWGVRRESLNPTAGLCWPRRSATFNVPPHLPALRRARDAAREYAGVRCVSTQPALERFVFSVSRSLTRAHSSAHCLSLPDRHQGHILAAAVLA